MKAAAAESPADYSLALALSLSADETSRISTMRVAARQRQPGRPAIGCGRSICDD
jgi:hypothetical protein